MSPHNLRSIAAYTRMGWFFDNLIWSCHRCSAVVNDREHHSKWHDSITKSANP